MSPYLIVCTHFISWWWVSGRQRLPGQSRLKSVSQMDSSGVWSVLILVMCLVRTRIGRLWGRVFEFFNLRTLDSIQWSSTRLVAVLHLYLVCVFWRLNVRTIDSMKPHVHSILVWCCLFCCPLGGSLVLCNRRPFTSSMFPLGFVRCEIGETFLRTSQTTKSSTIQY